MFWVGLQVFEVAALGESIHMCLGSRADAGAPYWFSVELFHSLSCEQRKKTILEAFCLFLSTPAGDSVLKTSPAPNLGYLRAIKRKPRELALLPFLKSRGL